MAQNIFEDHLEQRGLFFTKTEIGGGVTAFVIESYTIPSGPRSGRTVGIGLPIPVDFPNVAPYGVHVRKDRGFDRPVRNEHPSSLGAEWSFWSRQPNWEGGRRTPQYYMDQVDSWLGEGE